MKKILLSNFLLCVLFAGVFWSYRAYKNEQTTELTQPLLYSLSESTYSLETYEGAQTKLWGDRRYATKEDVEELTGWQFIKVLRNSRSQFAIEVLEPTVLYTMGNSQVPNNYRGWDVTDIDVYVYDFTPERAYDAVYRKQVLPGKYIINFLPLIPSPPIFFKPGTVSLIGTSGPTAPASAALLSGTR